MNEIELKVVMQQVARRLRWSLIGLVLAIALTVYGVIVLPETVLIGGCFTLAGILLYVVTIIVIMNSADQLIKVD